MDEKGGLGQTEDDCKVLDFQEEMVNRLTLNQEFKSRSRHLFHQREKVRDSNFALHIINKHYELRMKYLKRKGSDQDLTLNTGRLIREASSRFQDPIKLVT